MKKPACILMDIEGTTTSISFVHETLFPYALKKIPGFISTYANEPEVRACLQEAQKLVEKTEGRKIPPHLIGEQMCQWIRTDKKHTPLKTLQGLIWKNGYESGEYKSHIYSDVLPSWKSWKKAGIRLGIYSSGSVAAQQLLFTHTSAGDLTPFLSDYFDTTTGPKKEANSYRSISGTINCPPEDILFLSDMVDELLAAREAGLRGVHILRPGTAPQNYAPSAGDFSQLSWSS